MEIRLTPHQIMQGSHVGIQRHLHVVTSARFPSEHASSSFFTGRYNSDPDDGWQRRIEGALGEMAVAQFLNVFWDGRPDSLLKGDVNGSVEVRTTKYPNGRLIVHPEDTDTSPYVLVVGANGEYQLAGWMWGAQAKREEFWCDPTGKGRSAYFVPQYRLNPMKALQSALRDS